MEIKRKRNRSSGPKKDEGLAFKKIPTRKLQQGAGSSGETLTGPAATSEPAAEIFAKAGTNRW
jgi:hypothetical protein